MFICRSDNCTYSRYNVQQTVIITTSSDATAPTLVISAPLNVGNCDNVTIDLTNSHGFGATYWLNVSLVVTSVTASSSSVALVQQYIDQVYIISPPAAIPRNLFDSNVDYRFSFSACNQFSLCSVVMSIVNTLSYSTPYVSFAGSSLQTVYRSQPLLLTPQVHIYRTCGVAASYAGLTYTWTVYVNNLQQYGITSTSANPTVFLLPAYTLSVGTQYTVSLRVLDQESSYSSIGSTIVYAELIDPWVVISGSSVQYLAYNRSLPLIATSSYASDPIVSKEVVYQWSCYQLLPTLSSSCGVSMVRNTSSSSIMHIFNQQSQNISVVIEVTMLLANNQSASAAITLLAYGLYSVAVHLPSISLSLSSSNNLGVLTSASSSAYVINADFKVGILANVLVSSSLVAAGSTTTAIWSCTSGSSSYVNISSLAASSISTPLSTASVVQTGSSFTTVAVNLVVAANTLTGGITYTFELKVSPVNAMISLYVNLPPTPGGLTVSPLSGEAFTTLFTFSASGWSDSNLPLSYTFGYVSSSSNMVAVSTRSVATYTTSYLTTTVPSGAASSALQLYVQVYDSYSSSSQDYTEVTLYKNNNQNSSSVVSLLHTLLREYSGNQNLITGILALGSSWVISVNCSLPLNYCNALHRAECSLTANTCGVCLSGYVGTSGDSNSVCISEDDFETSVKTSRRQLTTAFHTDLCHHVTETCAHQWQVCDVETGRCVDKSQSCAADCNGQGECLYKNRYTGKLVHSCTVLDPYCVATCQCDAGYAGSACSMTSDEEEDRISMSDLLLSLLNNQTLTSNFQIIPDLAALITQTNALTYAIQQTSKGDVETVLQLCDTVLEVAASLGYPSETLLSLADSYDFLASYAYPHAFNRSTYLTALHTYTASLLQDAVLGQYPASYLGTHVRIYAKLFSATYNASQLAALQLPNTPLENALALDAMSTTVPQVLPYNNSGLAVTGVQLSSRLFAAEESISNIMLWWFTASSSSSHTTSISSADAVTFNLSCSHPHHYSSAAEEADGCGTVTVVIPYNQAIHIIPPYEEIHHTSCYDLDHYIQNYTCLTSVSNITNQCPGVYGTYVDRCPIVNVTTVCAHYATTSSHLYRGCTAVSYDDYNITCHCVLSTAYPTFASNYDLRLGNLTINHTSSLWSTLPFGYTAVQITDVNHFDAYFDIVPALEAEVTVLLYFSISGLVGALVILGITFYQRDNYDSHLFTDKYQFWLSKKKKQQQYDDQQTTTREVMDSDDIAYQMSAERKETEQEAQLNYAGRGMTLKHSIIPSSSTGHDFLQQQVPPTQHTLHYLTTNDVQRITVESLLHVLPRYFSPHLSWFYRISLEFVIYHRWLSVFFHKNSNYARSLRATALAVQALCPLFLSALYYYLTNPDDGSCGQYRTGRACMVEAGYSEVALGESKCYWTHNNHRCNFRQRHEPIDKLILIAAYTGILSIPIARCFEYFVLLQLCIPVVDEGDDVDSRNDESNTVIETGVTIKGSKRSTVIGAAAAWARSSGNSRKSVVPFNDNSETMGYGGGDNSITPPLRRKPSYSSSSYSGNQSQKRRQRQRQQQMLLVRARSYVKYQSIETEYELILRRVKVYVDALTFLSNPIERRHVLHAWGMDPDAIFYRSSLTLSPAWMYQIDDRCDVLIRKYLLRVREAACQELATLAFGATTSVVNSPSPIYDEVQTQQRLLYLWQRDLLASELGSLLLENKLLRDLFILEWSHYPSYLFRFAYIGPSQLGLSSKHRLILNIICFSIMFVGMISGIIYFAYYQAFHRQLACASSFFIWIGLDLLFVSGLEVLCTHSFLPSYIYRDLLKVQEQIVHYLHSAYETISSGEKVQIHYRKSSALSIQEENTAQQEVTTSLNSLKTRIAVTDTETMNSNQFFTLSHRIAQYFGTSFTEARLILAYTDPYPPGHHLPVNWLLRPFNQAMLRASKVNEEYHSFSSALLRLCTFSSQHFAPRNYETIFSSPRRFYSVIWRTILLWFLKRPFYVQDIIIQTLCFSTCCLLLYGHYRLYDLEFVYVFAFLTFLLFLLFCAYFVYYLAHGLDFIVFWMERYQRYRNGQIHILKVSESAKHKQQKEVIHRTGAGVEVDEYEQFGNSHKDDVHEVAAITPRGGRGQQQDVNDIFQVADSLNPSRIAPPPTAVTPPTPQAPMTIKTKQPQPKNTQNDDPERGPPSPENAAPWFLAQMINRMNGNKHRVQQGSDKVEEDVDILWQVQENKQQKQKKQQQKVGRRNDFEDEEQDEDMAAYRRHLQMEQEQAATAHLSHQEEQQRLHQQWQMLRNMQAASNNFQQPIFQQQMQQMMTGQPHLLQGQPGQQLLPTMQQMQQSQPVRYGDNNNEVRAFDQGHFSDNENDEDEQEGSQYDEDEDDDDIAYHHHTRQQQLQGPPRIDYNRQLRNIPTPQQQLYQQQFPHQPQQSYYVQEIEDDDEHYDPEHKNQNGGNNNNNSKGWAFAKSVVTRYTPQQQQEKASSRKHFPTK